jgi:hypothetical protein
MAPATTGSLRRLGALELTITETVLVFVGIPLVVMTLMYGLVYGLDARSRGKRYRPGRPYNAAPVWYLANKRSAQPATESHAREVTAVPEGELATVHYGETGGASDSW